MACTPATTPPVAVWEPGSARRSRSHRSAGHAHGPLAWLRSQSRTLRGRHLIRPRRPGARQRYRAPCRRCSHAWAHPADQRSEIRAAMKTRRRGSCWRHRSSAWQGPRHVPARVGVPPAVALPADLRPTAEAARRYWLSAGPCFLAPFLGTARSGRRCATAGWHRTAFSRSRADSVLSCSGGARRGRTAVIKEYQWLSKDVVLAGGLAP